MRSLKRVTVVALVIIITTIGFIPCYTVFASGHGGHFKKILSQLNLTDEQKTKIKEIMKEVRTEHKDDNDKTKKEKMEIAKDIDVKIKSVLTAEQLQKYDELKADAKEQRKHKKEF